jgi:formate/nitrite transporter
MPGVAANNPGLVKFIFGAVFPIGLVLVMIGGAELFTSDCAVIPFGVLNKTLSFKRLFRIWSLVYLGNFAGALLVAYVFAYKTDILSTDPWLTSTIKIGIAKTSGTFLKTFIKGIGANWLVCMAVWVAYAAKEVTGKIIAMWFPVMCFVAFGFEHSIANMFFIPTAMLLGADITLYQFLVVNLLPATLGNIVGGALCVALAYWFMFSADKPAPTGKKQALPSYYNFKNIEHIKKNLN